MNHTAGIFILIGLMGAGKTTLGRKLSEHYQIPFYDSDQVICERTGVNIPTIFEMEGELGFRQRENKVIQDLCCLKNIVLATGGGAILWEQNRHLLQKSGTIIYLHAQPDTLFKRTQYDKNRPLLQTEQPLQRLQELYQQRDPIYRQIANIIFDAEHDNAQYGFMQLLTHLSS